MILLNSLVFVLLDGTIDYLATIQQQRVQQLLGDLHVLSPLSAVCNGSVDDQNITFNRFRAFNEAETCVSLIPRIGEEFVPPHLQ